MGKVIAGVMILVVLGLVGWYCYCPVPVMDDFEATVKSGKGEDIMAFVSLPELKANTAKFVTARYNHPEMPANNLTPEAIQAFVNAFITPENIRLIMKGVKIEPGSAPPAAVDEKAPLPPIERHYETPDVYAIDVYLSQVLTPDNKVSLLFQREGPFGWKLAAFRFSWG